MECFYVGRSTVEESIVVPIRPKTRGHSTGLRCDQELHCTRRFYGRDKLKDRQRRKKVAKKRGRDVDSIEERADRRFRLVHDPH